MSGLWAGAAVQSGSVGVSRGLWELFCGFLSVPLAPGLVWTGPGLKPTHLRFFTDLRISQGGRREGGGETRIPESSYRRRDFFFTRTSLHDHVGEVK